jgi:hypothetical protein
LASRGPFSFFSPPTLSTETCDGPARRDRDANRGRTRGHGPHGETCLASEVKGKIKGKGPGEETGSSTALRRRREVSTYSTSLRFTEVRGDSAALDADTGYGGGFQRRSCLRRWRQRGGSSGRVDRPAAAWAEADRDMGGEPLRILVFV